MAQLVASMSGVVLGGVVEILVSNLARGKIFTASIGSVDLLYPSVYSIHSLNQRYLEIDDNQSRKSTTTDVGLFSLMLNVPVSSYDHVGTVNSPINHILFPGQA